jgi:hypothetical protein
VRTVPAWGDRKVAGGAAGRPPLVRPVRVTGQTVLVWANISSVSVLVRMLGLV